MDKFTKKMNYWQYIRHLLPSIMTAIFVSFYTVIDGFFVVRSSGGELALAGINIVLPITSLTFGSAVMLATGVSAIIGKKMGEGKNNEVNGIFSFISLVLLLIGAFFTVIGLVFIEDISILLGASETLMPYVIPYCFTIFAGFIPMSFKLFFEYLVRTDGNPRVAMVMSGSGVLLNILFDYLFVIVFEMGTLGAGLGTTVSVVISGLIGLVYFLFFSHIRFSAPKFDLKILLKSMANGSSEMLTELSSGIVTLVFNLVIFKYYGENGIAAITIIIYIYYFFLAFYQGISVGSAPYISYNYGAKNPKKIREIFKYSTITIMVTTVIVLILSYGFSGPIIDIFANTQEVKDLTVEGLNYFALLFIFVGFNVFMSSYFTALGDGLSSAIISTLRSLIFILLYTFILEIPFGAIGVWLSMPCSELSTLIVTIILFTIKGKKYLKNSVN